MTRLPLLTTLLLSGLLVAGCNGDKSAAKAAPATPSTSVSAVSTGGATAAGTVVRLGHRAVVRWRAGKAHSSLVAISVTGVKRGRIRDLASFRLGRAARASTVYYVSAVVRNVGTGNLSGRTLALYGKVSPHLVVQPVRFTGPFGRCDHRPLPAHFSKGARARVCMVMLAPRHGTISSVEWRSPRLPQPVSWRVR